jgi:polyketide biosynthesis acyl carrier protein
LIDQKKQILEVVLKNLRMNVENLEEQEIDTSKSMMDYGASSLDIVEVVTTSIQDLDIKVPRTQLAGLKNINELVELFVRLKSQQT